ncbi:Alpha-parvin [Clonorchis sinensis]|uniref:Alpha-parvin n=1 Tax=Clonorchis sinensis TaxID=79923 RepID=A0A3R7JU13_CLOSI|nr:Alpha-parvin [Clonorchis sinensis]
MTTLAGLKSHDSLLSKLDTFKRKKKDRLEVEELTKESNQAIKLSSTPFFPDPKDYNLQEGEERSYPEMSSMKAVCFQELTNKLLSWINNELAAQRILVRDLKEDIYDGQVLQKLVEKLTGVTLAYPEVTQSEVGQLQRLKEVLATINSSLRVRPTWTAELIYNKDIAATLRLLVALATHFKSEMHFQPGVYLTVIVARKLNGKLQYRHDRQYITELTGPENSAHPSDLLSRDHLVVQTLNDFVNAHLGQLTLQVTDLARDFSDGVLLILLMGLLEGYFVPFYAYHPTPTTEVMRTNNVKLAFELMQAAGIGEPPAQPEEIITADSKAILRVLYSIYSFYERMEQDRRRYEIANIRELEEPEETHFVEPEHTDADLL